MAINLDCPPGATPLDADELASLIPSHITTQGELNDWEQLNILQGESWAHNQRKEILNEAFLRLLHKQMFGETWRWAGEFRKSDKNIGVDWLKIGVELRKLLDDVRYQIEHAAYPADEIAARFHHRLVAIHPFPNGNGRHARLMADLLGTARLIPLYLGQSQPDRCQRNASALHRRLASRRCPRLCPSPCLCP